MSAEPAPEAVAVIDLCERLVDRLRNEGTAGAQNAIRDLKASFPALEKVLQETRLHEMEAAVAGAVGAALTHTWVITEDGIDCSSCNVHTVDHVLMIGALPDCRPGEPCTSWSDGHLVLMGDDPLSKRCVYCRTVWQAATIHVGINLAAVSYL
jgi:hypothetical protein